MKTLKKLFYGLSICILMACVAILAIAMNPQWSEKLAKAIYGEEDLITSGPTPTAGADMGDGGIEQDEPQRTPMVYATEAPDKGKDDAEQVPEQDDGYVPKTIDIKTVCPPVPLMTSYVKPAGAQDIPATLSGLCGYVEIGATMTEVTGEEATKLKESLSEGDTGALLVFEQRFYPYYHMLNDTEKELYRQIFANAYAMNGAFRPCVEIFSTHVAAVVEAVLCDNPVLFWVEPAFACKYGKDGRVVEIAMQYNETADKAEQSKRKFEEEAGKILDGATALKDDYAKEKYVHDQLMAKVSYSTEAPMNQSAYSAMVNGKTVCAGYARAFQYLMQQLGIPCYYCRGYSGENHAWNIIELHGAYYNVDVTWDDTEKGTYAFFNKTDKDLEKTHVRRSLSVNLPACTGTLYGGLELSEGEKNPGVADGLYSEGLAFYYDKLCERVASGYGRADYSDILDAAVWKELEEAYTNGNNRFREDYLVRALYSAGAEYCIISLSAEKITNSAFEVNCSIIVE